MRHLPFYVKPTIAGTATEYGKLSMDTFVLVFGLCVFFFSCNLMLHFDFSEYTVITKTGTKKCQGISLQYSSCSVQYCSLELV